MAGIPLGEFGFRAPQQPTGQTVNPAAFAGGGDGAMHGVAVVAIDGQGVPAVGGETFGDVFGPGEVGLALDGDAVVVVEDDELAEAEVAGK